MTAYYNEHDPHAAQWLRNLIERNLIAPGVVDERSIEGVVPSDLDGFTQVHFFAGIGVWSYALRQAGWPDDRPVWTGSCPCQPFSAAGKGGGFADERHLWPAFHWLIDQCRPPIVIGEQVASKDGLAWLDLVCADLEGSGYAFGALDLCAAGVGAPHIRQRLYWIGAKRLADAQSLGLLRRPDDRDGGRGQRASGQGRETGGVDDTPSSRLDGSFRRPEANPRDEARVRLSGEGCGPDELDHGRRPGPTNGCWRDADWLGCTDGKWRPVEPVTFPLVDGAAFRVGSCSPFAGKSRAKMLKGYGNALCAEVAAEFIRAAMATIGLDDRMRLA